MNTQVLQIAEQIKATHTAEPWYGKSATALLESINPADAFEKPGGQHSILELVWHMVNWKSFVISRLRKNDVPLQTFEDADWRTLDHSDKRLWQQGLQQYHQAHNELVEVLQQQTDDLLPQQVPGRTYTYHDLLHGIMHHDIYHLGQVAYIQKLLRAKGGE